MQDSTGPQGSTSSALTTCYKPPANTIPIPIFEDECSKRAITDLPSLDAMASLVGNTLTLDLESQDPLRMTPGSKAEKHYLKPIKHHWQHYGTENVTLGEWETRVDLFAVDLATRKSKSQAAQRSGLTLRAIFSQRRRRLDGRSGGIPRASMSFDNFPTHFEFEINSEIDRTGDPKRPNHPNAYVVSVPHSMIAAMEAKISEGGDADLPEILAQTMVHKVDQILGLHFEGSGEVIIPHLWSIPPVVAHTNRSENILTRQNDHIYDEWDALAREELEKQRAEDAEQREEDAAYNEEGSWSPTERARLEEEFRALKNSTQNMRKSKMKKSKRTGPAHSHASDAGTSR